MTVRMWFALGSLMVGFALALWVGLPRLLGFLGLHRHYAIPTLDLRGHRALIVTTSTATMAATGKATGVWASEMTVAYYAFADAGMEVDVASIAGGPIPVEASSLRWPIATPADRRFRHDPASLAKTERSVAIDDVDIGRYDIVYLAGGWGAAYDLGQSAGLGRQISAAYAGGAVVGGVCHGPLGLLQATNPDGSPLLEGRHVTGVTDKQITELRITLTPMHPERELRAAGAVFEAEHRLADVLASHVVADGRIVTGQNQNSAAETAHAMMSLLAGHRGPADQSGTGSG